MGGKCKKLKYFFWFFIYHIHSQKEQLNRPKRTPNLHRFIRANFAAFLRKIEIDLIKINRRIFTPDTPKQSKIKMPVWTWNEPEKIAEMCRDCSLMRGCVINEFAPNLKHMESVYKTFEDTLAEGGEPAMKIIELARNNYERKQIKDAEAKKKAKSAARAEEWDKEWEVGRYSFRSSSQGKTGEFTITKISKGGFATIVPHDHKGTKPHRRYLKKTGFLINYATDDEVCDQPLQINSHACWKK
jgi:hypothetical protein